VSLVEPAWILRSARRHCADGRLRTAAEFAAGGGVTTPVHRSRVARWENGSTEPWYDLVRRYELVCGYPAGQLVTAVDIVNREAHPVSCTPRLARPPRSDPVPAATRLVRAALDDESLCRAAWDDLSATLGALPAVLLMPEQWTHLLTRGLHEMSLAVGLDYLQRLEAMARLAGHPCAGRHVLALFETALTDPTSQVFSETAALMQYCDHPDAAIVLLKVARHAVNDHALRAALTAAATMLRGRRVEPARALELAQLALDCCRDPDRPYRVRRCAADVLRALTPRARRRIVSDLRSGSTDQALASILEDEGPRPLAQSKALGNRIRQRVQEQLGSDVPGDDDLLRLLRHITVETNDQRRADALELMMLLPFGPVVGTAYADELRDSMARGDVPGMHECLGVLSFLAPAGEASLLADLAVTSWDATDGQVAVEASWALGNLRGTSSELTRAEESVAEAVRRSLADREDVPEELYPAWAYALGMRGRRDLLSELVAAPQHHHGRGWAEARRWWLELPGHLRSLAVDAPIG